MKNAIKVGDMVATKLDGLYVAARVTKVMTHNLERLGTVSYLVKTTNGHLHAVSDLLPMRDDAESQAVIQHMISGN